MGTFEAEPVGDDADHPAPDADEDLGPTGLAHRMAVLAQDQRSPRVAARRGPRRDARRRRVHRAHDVARRRRGVEVEREAALVLDRTATGRCDGSTRPWRRGSAPSPASLPSDQTITHGCDRSRCTMRDARSTSARAGTACRDSDRQRAWRLDVRLVDDVQAEFVAQVVERLVVRVVRRAHRVDVVLLHQFEVAADVVDRDRPAAVGMVSRGG